MEESLLPPKKPPIFKPSPSTTLTLLITISLSLSLIHFTSPQPPNRTSFHSLFLSSPDNATIAHHLLSLTRRPHIAGSPANSDAASYVLSTLSTYSIPTHFTFYNVSLSYPISRSLILTLPPNTPTSFSLLQDIYDGDPFAEVASEAVPTFHAYAKSASAAGHVAYVNYGRVEDYATLEAMGVNVSGAVVLAKYGKIYRGDIVRNAYEAGAVGAVVYTDTKDYGGDERWFPDDRWMPPSGVQVGSVYTGKGDPTTPGWPSSGSCERLSDEEVERSGEVPLIPSLPVSSADGKMILQAIGGHMAPDDWQGRAGSPVYSVGPGPGYLNLTYKGTRPITTIQNVVGVIEGAEEPDRYVILGNHRDAWTFGAVDPNSGTATLLEVARRLEKLQKRGWKPRRTIVLCNWDAEEYGLIGSTEWVEENRELLASRAVAYINVDIAVAGPGFDASSTPQIDKLLEHVTQQVQDPDNSSQTVYESWTGSKDSPMIGRLGGGGSDYAAFVQHVGVPAVDMSFGGGYPVYHSLYDDFIWMQKFGDPMFKRHVAAASIWGLLALKLADEEFLPFDYLSYAFELEKSTRELENEIMGKPIDLIPLYKSIEELKNAATNINVQRKELERNGRASVWGKEKDKLKVRELNDRLMMAERAFTDREGLSERQWYKHLVYAPSKHNDYGSKSFPGVDDTIEKAKSLDTVETWKSVQHEVWRVSRAVTHASLVLNGKFT
eukprot:TRINITY_DN5301_c1_g1_i1.p1 TRINITY_DN5301_c1_g1~~TRINITY_DN5301_c1_g1_i1.p1  ORF type:complete len:720 (+),score=139.20 TRINITY_DN5301_c1_g1_i1:101-2260(+)